LLAYSAFKRHLAATIGILSALVVRPSIAQPALDATVTDGVANAKRYELTWLVPAGCPTHDIVGHDVDELIADSPKLQQRSRLAATGSIVRVNDGFTLTLTLRDAEGSRSRTIEAPACEELGKAASLIVALALDPSILERRHDPTDAKVAELWANALRIGATESPPTECVSLEREKPSPQVVVVAPPTTQTQISSTEPLPYRLGFGMLVGFGVLPHVSFGSSVNGAIQQKASRLELAASRFTADANSPKNNGGAHFELYRLAPRACWLVADTAWSAGPCAAVEVGMISGQGYGLPAVYRKTAFWLASSVGGMFEWRAASSSFLGVSADLGIPLRHDSFKLAGDELFRPAISATVLVSLSAGWR
jgi:hypothetical protein